MGLKFIVNKDSRLPKVLIWEWLNLGIYLYQGFSFCYGVILAGVTL
jgi:hypothetical protein